MAVVVSQFGESFEDWSIITFVQEKWDDKVFVGCDIIPDCV